MVPVEMIGPHAVRSTPNAGSFFMLVDAMVGRVLRTIDMP
jgi:hypothetical protein